MNQNQLEIPIQPVERPILCSPDEEPDAHWAYDTESGEAIRQPGTARGGLLVQNATHGNRATSNALRSGRGAAPPPCRFPLANTGASPSRLSIPAGMRSCEYTTSATRVTESSRIKFFLRLQPQSIRDILNARMAF